MTAARDRGATWLPLLRTLTAKSPTWTVWKNLDSALYGGGDVDAAAPRDQWPVIEDTFRNWARDSALAPVVVCRHIPGGFNLVALARPDEAFFELGVKDRRIFRGATLFRAAELSDLTDVDPRGFRRVRPGAEGLFKLLLNGTRRGGGKNTVGLEEKGVAQLLRSDLAGVERAAEIFGPVKSAAVTGARAVAEDRWNARAMRTVEAWFVAKAVAQPYVSLPRIYFKLMGRKRCPVVQAILSDDRRVHGDRARWIRTVAADHPVYGSDG